MDALGKFGEHERSVRVAPGAAESNSGCLSALQTSQVHKLDIRTAKSMTMTREKMITFLLRGKMIFCYHVNRFLTVSRLSETFT